MIRINTKNRIFLIILMVLLISLCMLMIAMEGIHGVHSCHDPNCGICDVIHMFGSFIKSLFVAAAVIFAVSVLKLFIIKDLVSAFKGKLDPVTSKVKMTN